MRSVAVRLGAVLLSAFFLSPPVLSLASPKRVEVSGIRCWSHKEYTHVVVDLSGEAKFEAHSLPADARRGFPPRIFVDIDGAGVREEILHRPVEVHNGLLKVVRAGRFREGVVRIVVDLERESTYRAFLLTDPARLVIDIEGKSRSAAKPPGNGAGEDAGAEARAALQPASHGRGKIVVMLDPGHGGKDPGAIGPTGLKEKDVVLAIGKMVRDRLRRYPQYEVRMTRDADVFIPLEERTAKANEAKADIFVSLHMNASRNRRAEGVSSYVLSRGASDREALELAARENGVPLSRLSAVKFIIDDLSTYGRKKESLRLAKTINDDIVRSVDSRFGRIHDLGLKQAPFYVLVGARMTAVLVEASFITNPREERRLRNPEYLATIADSVVEAIRYYGEQSAFARAAP